MQRKRWMTLGGGGMSCLILIALFTARVHVNPQIDPSLTLEARMDVPPHIAATLRRACFDCHSNQTRWPWYSQVPPGVWMVSRDVQQAREVMNFSDWPDSTATDSKTPGLLLASCAVLRAGVMPPQRYLVLHPEARVSKDEVAAVCGWSQTQVAQISAARRRLRHAAPSAD